MDNQWQPTKCGSTCQSSADPAVVAPSPVSQVQSHDSSRNSMMNPSHYYYPHIVQEPCSSTRKTMADPLFQATNINLYNSSLSVMGSSFFTLLSGPPASFSKYDSQHVLSSKSSKVQVHNSSSIVGPTECEPSFDNRYLKSKVDASPVIPVRALASDGGNTACLHDMVQVRKASDPNLEPAKVANYHTSHGIEQLNGFSSLKAPPTCGLPRVFCLYASGDLFLSSSGLLGVVCSCHGIRMSISKFSEHSGLQDVNPGDAVHTDSGETIAQWRKVYFSKFGIRIPEDPHGWHWPQGFSAAPELLKKSERAPNMSRTSDLSKSPRPLNNMVFPDKHHSTQNLVNEILCHEVQRDTHDNHDGFTKTSQSNVQSGAANKIMEQLVSGCLSMSKFADGLDNAFQSSPTYIDPIYKTKNSFTSQNKRSLGKDSDKFNSLRDVDKPVKATVSSNIELRLGQPSQQSNAPGFHASHVSRVSHPLELVSSQPKLYNAGSNRITEESKQVVDCAAQAAKSSLTEGQNRMKFSNLGFGAFSTRMTLQPEQEATRVMNPHTPLSRQKSLKYMNHGDVSSSYGFGKDQIVPGNSLNRNLMSSMTLPSKLTGRDGYKQASKYNLPEHAMKSVHYGTTSWTADKSAVISSFQIRDRDTGVHNSNHLCNPDQTGPSMPRIGISENIRSSSGHGNCCQGTPCAYVPDKCSCCIQRNTMIENSNLQLQGRNSISAFGEPSQIGTSILSASNLNPSGKIGETMKPNLKKVEFNAFQWKDVPSKMSGRCHVPCKDQKAKFLEDRIEVNDQTSGVADQPLQKGDCMKEQVMSNISSKCSTPALTQASVKISNGDSCTDDAHNTGCAKNFAVDEGSGIQKSSDDDDDDALDSGGNTGFDDSACKISLKNGTRSLIDELRVIDSLRVKKVHNGLSMHESTSSMKTFEKDFEAGKRKRETKFKILGTSFPASPVSSLSTGSSGQSSQSLEDVHKSTEELLPCKKPKRIYDDCLESREGKKTRLDFDFAKRKPCKRIIRPVVCGRYGLISNGDTSKPAKIFSLGKILKTSKRCNHPPGNKIIKKSPEKVLKKSRIREGYRRSGRISSFKEDKYNIGQGAAVVSDEDSMETSKDTDTSYVLKKEKESINERSHGIPDSDLSTKTRRKVKEVRKRSIYELITNGKDATISKDIASVPQDNLKCDNSNNLHGVDNMYISHEEPTHKSTPDVNKFCNVCGGLNNDEINSLLECNRCLIKVHQACYGVSKVPKSYWCCRPCRENVNNMVCVLCGYEGGVMTRAIHTTNIVKTLLNAWNVNVNVIPESQKKPIMPSSMLLNSVTAGVFDSSVKQWVHMVCGLWTPGTRCPNVDTMSTFDVSGASHPQGNDNVCSMCKRGGGCCIRCRVVDCVVDFHPWCAHQKGLLQSEVEGADNEKVGFYGRCEVHAANKYKTNSESIEFVRGDGNETCARTEGYKGRKREGFRHDSKEKARCVVGQEQVDAWNHMNQQLSLKKQIQRATQAVQEVVESDPRKEYGRYKQSKGWKHLVVYKSGIHALGLYTSMFISQSEMVVEYVGEIVGLRVADRREREYESGKQLQYKSACYFFRIDKEHIIDATRKGGIARFVNHSCQPNCVAKVITVRGEKKVVFFAERDIYPGEEITYDYHFNNEDEAKKILCSCNSNNCRRYLN
ncbi:uncharacterized protein LOC111909928 isoform X3 [Lactuca sativa]|uniref:uncharacterized protein LOC111909928 isoform X3 n=1 Tax=Lactuca sativa TaxID=4236 RepID=UPI001C6891C1|nr:uncharacterized protein LOC111909928 isoform X3 [Lactuca sativa]